MGVEYVLGPQDQALLVCSDGVWDVISPQESADIIKDFAPWQAMEAAQRLADEACARWSARTYDSYADDITVVLGFLQGDATLSRSVSGSTEAPSCRDLRRSGTWDNSSCS